MAQNAFYVRINGVLPDVPASSGGANTSMSVFCNGFHLLVDAGGGVAESIRRGASDLGHKESPDAVLITHGRREHVADLPAILSGAAAGGTAKVYCTSQCADQVVKELPELAGKKDSLFTAVAPGQQFEAGPFSITPVAAENAGDSPGFAGSVIYVIRALDKKVVAGWDFLKLSADPALMWNPDLLVLGTETYNEHPSTGMISVSEAYNLARRWNAKDCYIVHYSGEKDKEDARNQWHRGPVRPLSPEELQQTVDGHLRVSGQEGKFKTTVARQGMVWRPQEPSAAGQDEGGPIGTKIEVEGLEKYVFALEKMRDGKLAVSVEDSINRLTAEFVNPKATGNSLHGDSLKSMMMKGPELSMTVSDTSVRIDIVKGRKAVFAGDVPVSERDAKRLLRYLAENFSSS